jgi:hypothetical protein
MEACSGWIFFIFAGKCESYSDVGGGVFNEFPKFTILYGGTRNVGQRNCPRKVFLVKPGCFL